MRLVQLVFPLLALLAGCAVPAPREEGAPAPRTDACVFQSSITGFRVLDDSRVVLYDGVGNKKVYLARVAPGCFDLSHQDTVAAIDRDGNGQICGYGRDDIAYRQFGRLESCRVTTLQQLTEEGLAAELEKDAKKPRKVIIE